MGSWRSSGYLEYGYFTVLGLLVLESDRLLYPQFLGHRGLLVVYVLFRTFYQTLPSGPPLLGTSGAPALGSSQDPVSLRSRSRNDSNTVSVLVSLMHLLQVHYRFFIHGAREACISGRSRPPGEVGLTPRQYTVCNVEGARSLYWRTLSQ